MAEPAGELPIGVTINGQLYERNVEARKLLVHLLRDELDLTGTHVGCDTANCGACTVILDGKAVKSCTILAVQVDGSEIRTVEGLSEPGGELTPLQRAFSEHHALQCGYCTPGMLMSATAFLEAGAGPVTRDEVRKAIQGNICRCTGYEGIVTAVEEVANGGAR